MTRLTIALPDDLAERIRNASDGDVDTWITNAARDQLLREEVAAIAAFEDDHRDVAWEDARWAAV